MSSLSIRGGCRCATEDVAQRRQYWFILLSSQWRQLQLLSGWMPPILQRWWIQCWVGIRLEVVALCPFYYILQSLFFACLEWLLLYYSDSRIWNALLKVVLSDSDSFIVQLLLFLAVLFLFDNGNDAIESVSLSCSWLSNGHLSKWFRWVFIPGRSMDPAIFSPRSSTISH